MSINTNSINIMGESTSSDAADDNSSRRGSSRSVLEASINPYAFNHLGQDCTKIPGKQAVQKPQPCPASTKSNLKSRQVASKRRSSVGAKQSTLPDQLFLVQLMQ